MSYTQQVVRRSLAILLAVVFSWMLVLPAFASLTKSSLPACCRKSGQHHCMLQGWQSSRSTLTFSAIKAKCPYCPQALSVAGQAQLGSPSTGAAIFAGLVRHPALSPQTEAAARISFYRSNQNRGPPSFLLS